MAEQDHYRRIDRRLRGEPATDGAGVRMTRVIANSQLDHFDPFLLLDEFRSDDPDDYIAGFPDHPHRGFETVTYMLAGAMQHADNQGNEGLLGPGSVQWMTAGRGIVHSEMPKQEDGLMWGFQLWVNLPASDKMTEPRYQDIPAEQVPEVELNEGVTVRVLAGHYGDTEGPVRDVVTEPLYFDVRIPTGSTAKLPLPQSHNAFVYCFGGTVTVEGEHLEKGNIGLLGAGQGVRLQASDDASCLVVAGRPLNETIARYGPFVMNTADEIRQAFVDFQSGRF